MSFTVLGDSSSSNRSSFEKPLYQRIIKSQRKAAAEPWLDVLFQHGLVLYTGGFFESVLSSLKPFIAEVSEPMPGTGGSELASR